MLLKWCHFSPSKPFFQPQKDEILPLPFSTDDLKIEVLIRRKSLSVRELVYHYLCSIVKVWLFLCFEYDFPNILNKSLLRINFSCNVQVTVIEYFSTLKVIVIKNAHALEFVVGNRLIWKVPVFGYIFNINIIQIEYNVSLLFRNSITEKPNVKIMSL